jgi:hypothetical protein
MFPNGINQVALNDVTVRGAFLTGVAAKRHAI